jgi:hypothetical protein
MGFFRRLAYYPRSDSDEYSPSPVSQPNSPTESPVNKSAALISPTHSLTAKVPVQNTARVPLGRFNVISDGNCLFEALGIGDKRKEFISQLEKEVQDDNPIIIAHIKHLIVGDEDHGKEFQSDLEGLKSKENIQKYISQIMSVPTKHYIQAETIPLIADFFHLNVKLFEINSAGNLSQLKYLDLDKMNYNPDSSAKTINILFDRKHYDLLVPANDFKEIKAAEQREKVWDAMGEKRKQPTAADLEAMRKAQEE